MSDKRDVQWCKLKCAVEGCARHATLLLTAAFAAACRCLQVLVVVSCSANSFDNDAYITTEYAASLACTSCALLQHCLSGQVAVCPANRPRHTWVLDWQCWASTW